MGICKKKEKPEEKNMRKKVLLICTAALFSLALTGCGETKESTTAAAGQATEATTAAATEAANTAAATEAVSADTTEATTTEAATTEAATTEATTAATTAATTEEKTTEAEPVGRGDAEVGQIYFGNGVYEVSADGNVLNYYCFYDTERGVIYDAATGDSFDFTCEQKDGTILFHFNDATDNSTMYMNTNEGLITGKFENSNKVYEFNPIAGDPGSFRVPETAAAATGEDYTGNYVETIAQRGTINLTRTSGNSYSIFVYWSSSAFEHCEWTFTGTFNENGVLNYTDCVKTTITFDEDQNESTVTNYTEGTGALTMTDEGLIWQDNVENCADGAIFAKY